MLPYAAIHLGLCCLPKYSKTCVKRPLSKRLKIGFQDQLTLNAGQSIAECSPWSILQYFRPSLSYHLSQRSLFCLFLSGHFTQVLLYLFQGSYRNGKTEFHDFSRTIFIFQGLNFFPILHKTTRKMPFLARSVKMKRRT